MIVVIADDLSGATELAGAAANHGLRAEVHTVFDATATADVVAVDTDTRSLSSVEGAQKVATIARAVAAARPAWIYKKTDSVMRGNVRAEIEAIRSVTGQPRALYIPANPSRQRIIRDGHYFVNCVPLHETAFARDPEHPRLTARVADLLALRPDETTLSVPNVASTEDVAARAAEVNATILPAGGVDFFQALLRVRLGAPAGIPTPATLHPAGRTLFVCGSAAAWDNGRAGDCERHGIAMVPMPPEIFSGARDSAALHQWSREILATFDQHDQVMLAIGRLSATKSQLAPEELVHRVIETVVEIQAAQPLARILLEGGATAAALLHRMMWTRLTALPAEFIGTAVLHPIAGPLLLIKPGSYPWPDPVWR